MTEHPRRRRRLRCTEVIQTSAMDCGPAALKCLLEGHGISASYGRLREACQTDVDGTSLDTLAEVANQLGLEAEQIMLPADHLRALGNRNFPALAVVRLPNGNTHFVVLWRQLGPLVEVMDPAGGRRYVTYARLLEELYIHPMSIAASDWREWAGGDEFRDAVASRLAALGVSRREAYELHARAASEQGWRALAALDAAVRMTTALVRARGLRRGREARRTVLALAARPDDIAAPYWSVQPGADADGEPHVMMSGAVLVTIRGASAAAAPEALAPELRAALEEPSARPGRDLWRLLVADGRLAPFALLAMLALVAGGLVAEALLVFGFLEVGRDLGTAGHRVAAVIAVLGLIGVMLAIDLGVMGGIARLGRRIEVRLRIAFLDKIPRLPDRYFRSRLTSDMAERSHSVHTVRFVSDIAARVVRLLFEVALTTIGLVWLFPGGAIIAIAGGVLVVLVPLVFRPALAERDLRVRTHAGALARFYLDALLGVVPIRTHGAESAVRREHESLLVDWCHAGYRFVVVVATTELVLAATGVALTTLLVGSYVSAASYGGATVLLLTYWALRVPVLGQELTRATREALRLRNVVLRLLEPLGAGEDTPAAPEDRQAAPSAPSEAGVSVELSGVTVQAGGHRILDSVDLRIEPGQHVGIVGVSGAGKSTLAGLLLGFHRPVAGQVRVDGNVLDGAALERLRVATAWVDPSVQVWNRSLLDNLYYGTAPHTARPLDHAIDAAELRVMLERMSDGLQTQLGESGACVSGGEGQRLRLGRALLRPHQRLVVLDEPFRGLDRDARRRLLARAREWWRGATLVCVTHDVGDTLQLDRVLVVESGKVIEHGVPSDLAARQSRYAELLAAEQTVREGVWTGSRWRRLSMVRGQLSARDLESA